MEIGNRTPCIAHGFRPRSLRLSSSASLISFFIQRCNRVGKRASEFINYNDESISIHSDRYHLYYHILWVIKPVRARVFSLLFSFIDFTLYLINKLWLYAVYKTMPVKKVNNLHWNADQTKVFDGKSIQFT